MKNTTRLKTLLLSFMLVACFVLPIKAQKSDGFFRTNNDDTYNDRTEGIALGGVESENPTPVGSGIIVLMAAGAGYALLKRKEDKQ